MFSRGRRRVIRWTAALAAVAAAAGIAGCGGAGSAGANGVTTITFWDDNGGPTRTPYYKALIAKFEAANPKIKVDYLGLPSDSAQQKYDTAIADGSTPDIGGVQQDYLADFVARNALVPLDSVANTPGLKGELAPSTLQTIRSGAPDGKLYMLPVSVNLDIIWYRADWFKQAGLAAPNTWQQFATAVQQLTNPAKKQYGYSIRGGAGGTSALLSLMYAYSGVPTFFTNGKCTIDDPKNVQAIATVASWYKKYTPAADVTNTYQQMAAEFDDGTVAMMGHNLGSYAQHQQALGAGKYAAAPVPLDAAGTRNLISNAPDGYGVFKASQHQAQAEKFLEFLLSASSNSYWNQKTGQLPANLQAQDAAWVKAAQPLNIARQTLAAPTTHVVQIPRYLPQYGAIMDAQMAPLWQEVLLGKLSPKSFATQWANAFTQAQQQWTKQHGH